MNTIKKPLFWLLALNIILPIFIWVLFKANIPQRFGLRETSIFTVFANYDGPNYLVISRCWYDKSCIGKDYSLSLPLEYYPAHFPGFPAIIAIFDQFFSGPWSMLLATLTGNLVLTYFSYKLFCLYTKPKKAFWLSVLFSIFPGRLFVTRLIGAPESWFVGSLMASIYYYKSGKSWLSALALGLAQSIKTPAVLLLLAFSIHAFLHKKLAKVVLHWPASALVILGIFMLYQSKTGDFLAYFHSGDNQHLSFMPFQVFLSNQTWVQTIWLEEMLYIYLLGFLGLFILYKKYKLDVITLFTGLFLLATVFVGHRDISRYSAPLYPLLFIAFAKLLKSRYLQLLSVILLPAIILYAINFIYGNTAPIADWAPYL